jgi:hypothetical protein
VSSVPCSRAGTDTISSRRTDTNHNVYGSGWESNPPWPLVAPTTGFEDRGAHRDTTTPTGYITTSRKAARKSAADLARWGAKRLLHWRIHLRAICPVSSRAGPQGPIDRMDPLKRAAQLMVLVENAGTTLAVASQHSDKPKVRQTGWLLTEIMGDDLVTDEHGDPQSVRHGP